MTPRPTPPTRIGDTERLDAQRARQRHLDAGRLQVAEFVERFAGAAAVVPVGLLGSWSIGIGPRRRPAERSTASVRRDLAAGRHVVYGLYPHDC